MKSFYTSPKNFKVSLYLFCFISLFAHVDLNGQNFLMQDNHSSFHTGVQISYNTFENYYAVLPGYTFNGRLTLGFDLGKTKDLVNKVNSTVLRPNISYLILKQGNDDFPISLAINAGYQFNYVSQVIFNAQSVQFGTSLYHEISPLENVKIIPALFFEGNKATNGLNPNFKDSVFISYGVQTSILWDKYYITPQYTAFDGVSTISVKLGMIFSDFISVD